MHSEQLKHLAQIYVFSEITQNAVTNSRKVALWILISPTDGSELLISDNLDLLQ